MSAGWNLHSPHHRNLPGLSPEGEVDAKPGFIIK
jgi:hypothetical protein